MLRYVATQRGSDTSQPAVSDTGRAAVSLFDLQEARLATELAGFGVPEDEICRTLNISPRQYVLRLYQYQAHISGYGAHPFPCLEPPRHG